MSQLQIQKPEHDYDFNDFLFGRSAGHVRRIEERAHRFFEERGLEHGHDLEDWLKAEDELNSEWPVRIETDATSVTITLTTPGFDADHLNVTVVPGWAVVDGEIQASGAKDGNSTVSAQTIFLRIPLPETADVDAAIAHFEDEELRIAVPLRVKKGAASEESPRIARAKTA